MSSSGLLNVVYNAIMPKNLFSTFDTKLLYFLCPVHSLLRSLLGTNPPRHTTRRQRSRITIKRREGRENQKEWKEESMGVEE